MEKEYNLQNSEVNLENTKIKSKGPSTDDLKSRFKEGSIPLQADYADLINIADIGRKATGQAPQQNGPGAGLKLDDNGTLNLKMGTIPSKDFSPLILEKDILSVDLGSGLINEKNGICVGQGNGIVVNAANVAVKADNGINVDGKGVSVKAGNGISVGEKGVEVKAKDKGSISVDSDGIAVKCWDGGGIVVTDNTGLYLKLEGGNSSNAWSGVSGLSLSTKGVKVKAGNGIKVDDKGVSIDPNKVLPRGMIVMFSGSSIPEGWALCDGKDNRPDLIDRFIMGGTTQNIGGKSSDSFSGTKNNKKFTFTSESQTVRISGKTDGHGLTADENGPHKHEQGETLNKQGMCHNGSTTDHSNRDWVNGGKSGAEPPNYRPYTFPSGKGNPHSHPINLTSGGHSHSNNVTVPYYILAFIIKL
ncbi:tail fiber protein [Photorhabdus akhurstii]|uniref:tail fiber protein n=1 Tax=Photorhabdus akhurstii TaxID=171438 RepID=UPI0037039159